MTHLRRYGKQDELRRRHAAVRGAYASIVGAAALGMLLRVGATKLPIRNSPAY